jgi:cell wall-associated NlpC family hydrolase
MGFLGVPYRRGGNSATTGFDCSGFVKAIYEQTVGLVLPRRANEQAAATQAIDKQDLQPGDLVFFNTMKRAFSHVGIYVGDGKFIHSPKPGAEVRVEDMRGNYWQHRFDGARRVLVSQQRQQQPQPQPQPPQSGFGPTDNTTSPGS